jgi:RNA polymerase sigma-70 factor (ECF subfamily)
MAPKSTKSAQVREVFEGEVFPHLGTLFNAALRLTRNPDDAGDLTQETVLRAWRFFDQFEPGTNCRGWLLTILHNVFRNGYRRTGRERPTSTIEEFDRLSDVRGMSADAPTEPTPESLLMDRSLDEQVAQALAALPEEFRVAILMVDIDELSYEEVANALEIPVGTVKSRVSRGRADLRRKLGALAASRGLKKPAGDS